MLDRGMGRGLRRGVAALLLAALPLSGCHTLRPVDPALPAPAPGAQLRIALTDAGSQAMISQVGPGVVVIEGLLEGVTPEAYTVAVRAVEKRDGDQDVWRGEPLSVPRSAVATVAERRLDRTRSVLLAGAVVVGVVAVGRAFGSGAWFDGSEGGGGPTPGN